MPQDPRSAYTSFPVGLLGEVTQIVRSEFLQASQQCLEKFGYGFELWART